MGFKVFHGNGAPDEYGNGDEYRHLPGGLLGIERFAEGAPTIVYSVTGWTRLEADAGHEPGEKLPKKPRKATMI
jgi:hypothetical protein